MPIGRIARLRAHTSVCTLGPSRPWIFSSSGLFGCMHTCIVTCNNDNNNDTNNDNTSDNNDFATPARAEEAKEGGGAALAVLLVSRVERQHGVLA